MKKLLLLAAMAVLALGASADGYKIEKVWTLNAPSFFSVTNDARQGFGMNGKFYIHNKAEQVIYEIDENGLTGVTYEGGTNTAVSRDEAGNIIVSNAGFGSTAWIEATFKVINPKNGEVKVYTIPEESGLTGRCDFFGFAKGNLLEEGELYLTAGSPDNSIYTDGIARVAIADGEVDVDNCFLASCAGLNTNTSTVIHYFNDLNGDPALLFAYRSGAPSKLTPDGDDFTRKGLVLPNKGACNGVFPIIWDGMELYLYPTLPNYHDGFAVAEAGAVAPLVEVPSSVSANPNGIQCNWLNAEVDENGVTIYQFVPGGQISVYRLTKEVPVYTVASNIFNNWEISEENNMALGEDGCYYLTKENVELTAGTMIEYKVTSNGTWWPADFNAEYYIGEDGIYDLVFVFNPDGGIVGIDVIKHEDPQPEMIYTVVGPAHVFGTEWDATNENNDMVKGEDGIYTWTKQGVQLDDFFGFKVVGNHGWDYEWPIGYENNWNAYLPDGAGVYDIVITFDPAQPEEKITCTLTKQTSQVGDIDMDGFIKISDVTALINYLLSNDATGIDLQAADCDHDTFVKISDVTTLINYLLSGSWE